MKYLNTFKTFENIDHAKSILKSLNLDINDPSYIKIREILKNNNGYVGWFTKLFYIKKYSIHDLIELFDFIQTNSAYISKLSTNIINYDNIEKLQDDIENVKLEGQFNKIYNEFPVRQKSLLDLKTDSELLYSLSRRRDIKSFFKKVSSYHTREELIEALKIFLKTDPNATMDKIMSIAKDGGSEITYYSYEDDILIVRVFNSEQLNAIAGDCSWCIRNSGTFASYINKESKQYIIFLFDRIDNLSRIGYTMRMSYNNFYYTSHDKSDRQVTFNELKDILAEYNFDIKKLNFKLSDIVINTTSVKTLMDIFDLSIEDVVKIKSLFSDEDLELFNKEQIDKWNLLEKSIISATTLLKYTLSEIISKKLLYRTENLYLSNLLSLYDKYGYESISYLKKNIKILDNLSTYKYKEANSDNDFCKKYIIDQKIPINSYEELYKMKVGSWRDDDKYSYAQTMFRLLWFARDIKKIIDEAPKKAIGNILYIIDDPQDITTIKFFVEEIGIKPNELVRYSNEKAFKESILEYCTMSGIKCDDIRKLYFNDVIDGSIDKYNLDKYKRVFTDDQYKLIQKEYTKQLFVKDLSNFRPYARNADTANSISFYENWNEYLKKQKNIPGYRHDDGAVNLILIYLRCDALDEINHLCKFYSYTGQTIVRDLNAIMSGTYRVNGGLKEALTEEQCLTLYRWLIKQDLTDLTLSRYSHKESPNGVFEIHEHDPRTYYLSSMYLYDRNEFDEYMTYYLSNLKYNYKKDSQFIPKPGDKKVNVTNRPLEIGVMFEFFERSKKVESYEYTDFVRELLSWGLSITELKSMLEYHLVNREDIRKLVLDELSRKASPETVRRLTRK